MPGSCKISPSGLLPLVALLWGGLVPAPDRGAAAGGRMARPVISLTCPAPADAALCRALVQALARAAPGRAVRIAPDPAAPDRPDGLALWLRIEGRGEHHLEGHLEWRDGGGAIRTGPPLRMDVQDAALSESMYPHFMADLLKISRLPL